MWCTLAENCPRIFSTAGFFLLLICAVQNVDSTETKEEEPAQLLPTSNFTEELQRAKQLVKEGDYATALELLPQLLGACESVLGPEHPLTVGILTFIETAYFNSGKYEEAVRVSWEIYKVQDKIHGKNHESTGSALLQLGYTYLNMKKYEKAEGALKRAYRTLKSTLGQNDPKTVDALFELANVYRESKDKDNNKDAQKLDLALRYYRKAHHVWSTHPEKGEENRDTRQALLNIGSVLITQNKLEEARGVLEKVVAMETKILGADHPGTLQVKNLLFRTLSRAGKAGEAKKILGKEDQDIDQDEAAIFDLVDGKVAALDKMGKFDKLLEILTEFYQQEMSKPQVSTQIFRILGKLIHYSRFDADVDTALKWGNVMIDLVKGQGQKVNFKGTVNFKSSAEERGVNMVRLHLDAIEICLYAYALKKDEQNIDHHFKTVPKVVKGHKVTDSLVVPLLSIGKEVVNFKLSRRKTDEAIKIIKDFMDIDHPRWGTVSLYSLTMILELSQQTQNYYPEIDSIAQKLWTNPRNLENDLEILKGVDQLIFKNANRFYEKGLYETAFGLYKVLDSILPTNWTEDEEFAPLFLQRVIKSAFIIKKSDQVLFYMRKNAQALKNKLTTQPDSEMDLDQIEKINQEIEKLQAFQEQIKITAEIPKDVEEFLKSRDFFWPQSTSTSNQDTREKTEL